MKYQFIKENRKEYPIKIMCKVLEVSRSGYHKWIKKKINSKRKEDGYLLEIILFHYKENYGNYGSGRITKAIRRNGIKVNKKRIARLMRINNIRAKTKKKFKITTKQDSSAQASPNLLNQDFSSNSINKIWTSDITYIWSKEGWLYLAVVMDLYSRKIVGWAAGKYISAELVIRALKMAFKHRNPDKGLVFHSDRGSQYSSKSFRKLLNEYGIVQSMSSTGNCYDNAVTESFFHTLKTELIYWRKYQTRQEAVNSIFHYIEIYYNRKRMHSTLGYLSPVEFENINNLNKKVA